MWPAREQGRLILPDLDEHRPGLQEDRQAVRQRARLRDEHGRRRRHRELLVDRRAVDVEQQHSASRAEALLDEIADLYRPIPKEVHFKGPFPVKGPFPLEGPLPLKGLNPLRPLAQSCTPPGLLQHAALCA